jgi:glycosyltransferase involved in cell wall biosynthesis
MPTAILDFDAHRLPRSITLPDRYERALVLVRWGGRPVGQMALPVRGGQVSVRQLRETIVETATEEIQRERLRAYLEQEAHPPPPATVAVCTRDRPDDLRRCLAAIATMPEDGREVLVVDSASRGEETRLVAEEAGVRYLREDRPGLDVARNRALREAKNPVIAFTDDDAMPDRGWLRALTANFEDPRVLCVTGLTMPAELETEAQELFERTNGFGRGFQRRVYHGTEHDPFLVARIGAGVNMALRRDVAELAGPFDEALDAGTVTRSGGDHDMFTRILASGHTIVYDPAALSWHRHRRSRSALRKALYGYGVGVYADLTGQLVRNRETRAIGIATGWFRSQRRMLIRSLLGRRDHVPLDLVIAELLGCVAGPRAYFVARRKLAAAREHAPEHP